MVKNRVLGSNYFLILKYVHAINMQKIRIFLQKRNKNEMSEGGFPIYLDVYRLNMD